MQKFFKRPVILILTTALIVIGLGYFNLSRGMSEGLVVLKSAGLLLWYVSLSLYGLYWKVLIKNNTRSQSIAFSALYGLIFSTGLFIVIWKPDFYDRGDLYVHVTLFIIMSFLQYHSVCSKPDMPTSRPDQP